LQYDVLQILFSKEISCRRQLKILCEPFSAHATHGNHQLTIDYMQKDLAGSQAQRLPAEAAIQALYHSCMHRMVPDSIAGAEYWVQVIALSSPLCPHSRRWNHYFPANVMDPLAASPAFASFL
jgi:hypothetical protein